MAERYLTRAASLSSGSGAARKGGEAGWGCARVGCLDGPAEDWLALTKFYSEWWPPSARAADALVRAPERRVPVEGLPCRTRQGVNRPAIDFTAT